MNKLFKPDRVDAAPATAQPFAWPVRVYYEDTDAGGVVFYANYLRFLERARTEWLRALGVEQPRLAAEHGVLFVVRAVQIEYLKPSRFNDSLQVTVEVVNVGASRIRFRQRVLRAEGAGAMQELVAASVDVVCVTTEDFKPSRVPRELRTRIGIAE